MSVGPYVQVLGDNQGQWKYLILSRESLDSPDQKEKEVSQAYISASLFPFVEKLGSENLSISYEPWGDILPIVTWKWVPMSHSS